MTKINLSVFIIISQINGVPKKFDITSGVSYLNGGGGGDCFAHHGFRNASLSYLFYQIVLIFGMV